MTRHVRLLCVLALALAAHSVNVGAQQPAANPAAQTPAKPKKAAPARASEAADPLADIRRATAISLVSALAEEARSFLDATLRARVQARSADSLWEVEENRARLLFRRAWEAAESADQEALRKYDEERRAARASGRPVAFSNRVLNLRAEVLRLAARRDRVLGEEFLAKLDAARKQAEEEAKRQELAAASAPASPEAARRPDPFEPPAALTQRLRLAQRLLEDGDTERAIQFADPALTSVNIYSMEFLVVLRTKDPVAADERYAAMLARSATDPAADANTVSLLSSYVFTPRLYMAFQPSGGANTSNFGNRPISAVEISPELRAAFFNAAAAILLRPIVPAEQDRTSAGRAGTYLVIARLLPLFEQHAPDKVAPLNAKLAALTPDTPPRSRDPRNSALTHGLVPDDPARDRVQEALDRLPKAKDAAERDDLYMNAALSAFERKDARVGEFIDKIESAELRNQLRSYVAFESVEDAIREAREVKDTTAQAEAAARIIGLARSSDLTAVQRTWALTEIARLMSKTDAGRAIEVLEEAVAEAKRIDLASPDRARALVAIATQFRELDRARSWEVMGEAVKASNAAPEFTGEDAILSSRIQSKNSVIMSSSNADSFDLAGIFTALAKEDLDRAVDLAKSFTAEAPRAAASLAIARAILKKP